MIQQVTTPRTDVSVLVRMPCPKIHRWRLFVTRIDRRSVASVQSGRSILHSATTFELPSVYEISTTLRFCVGVAHYAISCGWCDSRCHLPSLTPVTSIVRLHHELLNNGTCQVGPHIDQSSRTLLITGCHTSLLKLSYPPCYYTVW
ncbi:uncharacterized protein TNCT_170821 [Trichonephila clavata]|uniref:Uncharacterized protein n=1 Tax=Trichonephila clavata TaxID=2740835 RepID=A0A8X6GIG7_TRICU|nr:uncharacterized protein TNCT_170821 [Trichonephila clavata]